MSTLAQFDEHGNQFELASNRGWGDFGRWIEHLGANNYPRLNELWNEGSCEDLESLAAEVDGALENGNPTDDDRDIGDRLYSALMQSKSAEILLITNGVAADTGEEEGSPPATA